MILIGYVDAEWLITWLSLIIFLSWKTESSQKDLPKLSVFQLEHHQALPEHLEEWPFQTNAGIVLLVLRQPRSSKIKQPQQDMINMTECICVCVCVFSWKCFNEFGLRAVFLLEVYTWVLSTSSRAKRPLIAMSKDSRITSQIPQKHTCTLYRIMWVMWAAMVLNAKQTQHTFSFSTTLNWLAEENKKNQITMPATDHWSLQSKFLRLQPQMLRFPCMCSSQYMGTIK